MSGEVIRFPRPHILGEAVDDLRTSVAYLSAILEALKENAEVVIGPDEEAAALRALVDEWIKSLETSEAKLSFTSRVFNGDKG